jgi:hypothetical protein
MAPQSLGDQDAVGGSACIHGDGDGCRTICSFGPRMQIVAG